MYTYLSRTKNQDYNKKQHAKNQTPVTNYLLKKETPKSTHTIQRILGTTLDPKMPDPSSQEQSKLENIRSFFMSLGINLHQNAKSQQSYDMSYIKANSPTTSKGKSLAAPVNFGIDLIPILKMIDMLPIKIFSQTDPADASKTPNVTEIFALLDYIQTYEPEKLGELHNFRRGINITEPDFAYSKDSKTVDKYYDPLTTPASPIKNYEIYTQWLGLPKKQEDQSRRRKRGSHEAPFPYHADGKGTGAVCLLDISTTPIDQIIALNRAFTEDLNNLISKFEQSNLTPSDITDIRQMCNTFVVFYTQVYRPDCEAPFNQIRSTFDEARDYFLPLMPMLDELDISLTTKPTDESTPM